MFRDFCSPYAPHLWNFQAEKGQTLEFVQNKAGWKKGMLDVRFLCPLGVIRLDMGFLMFSLSKFQFWYCFVWGVRGAKLVKSFSVDVWLGIWIEVLYLLNLKDALFPLFPSSWNPVGIVSFDRSSPGCYWDPCHLVICRACLAITG